MMPSEFEYLFVLMTFFAVGISILWVEFTTLLSSRLFWFGCSIFYVLCLAIEIIALKNGWWTFVPSKHLGLKIWQIPLEEFLLFGMFYALTVSAWEKIQRDA